MWSRIFNFIILSSPASHLESANRNEINRDVHIAYTLFKVEKSMYLMVQCSLKFPSHEC